MKILFLTVLFFIFAPVQAAENCRAEPTIEQTGKILRDLRINANGSKTPGDFAAAETILRFRASVKNASWSKVGVEAAILTVFVDGRYNQDAILWHGEKSFEYEVLLGRLGAGEHRVSLVFNRARSAPNVGAVKIESAVFENFSDGAPIGELAAARRLAIANAPFIYARPETIDKFSDVPLVTYYEIFAEPGDEFRVRYTAVFSNEDGGTQSAALLARWGRLTDIEWVYEFRANKNGEILSEIYQGANHETKIFRGRRVFGSRPLIFNQTINNNFADAGCSPLRFSPALAAANLTGGSRETVMDNLPWTYRIMADEAVREGRVNAARLGADAVADLRDYFFVEVFAENRNAAVWLGISDANGGKSRSDWNDERLRVNRSGYFRIAVLPPNRNVKPVTVSLNCSAAGAAAADAGCQNARIVKIWRLDEKYNLTRVAFEPVSPVNLKPETNLIVKLN